MRWPTSVRTGIARDPPGGPGSGDAEVRPSVGPWLEIARNVRQFANDNGTYDDLLAYLRKRRMA